MRANPVNISKLGYQPIHYTCIINYSPILKLGSGIMAAANFYHHNCHQQEECCHGKADSIHCQVSHKAIAVTTIRNMIAEVRNLLQLISDTRGKHNSRQDCSQEKEDGVDNS